MIEIVMNFLEKIGYRPESYAKSRSQLHDVTHVIYGSLADIFVSNDDRLRLKARAAYSYLGIRTRVRSFDEFQQMVGPPPVESEQPEEATTDT
jgi:hypothetical protein